MSITKEFDTITAISTPLGEGAIGIVRLSGTDALAIAQSVFKGKNLEQVASHTINYGHIIDPKTGTIIDEVMVSVMLAPKTFTRENVVEINTHGGIAVTNEILQLLIRQGARMAQPGEFTKRAFLNGRVDLTQAEAVMDIIRAKTDKAMTIAVKQLDGSLSQLINDTRQEILNTLAQVEVNIDYPEYDDVEEMTTALLREKTQEFQSLLENLLRTAKRGKILREGLSTAIIGRPNVGKSSLLNNLLREDKAIVTDIAGTTRDVIEEYVNIKGVPLKLVDTAGIRETDDLVEQIGVERSKKALQEADLVLLVLNASEKLTDQDWALLNLSQDSNRIILLNKTDLEQKIELEQLPDDYIPISVLTNQNINLIEDRINQLFFDNAGLVEQDATYLSNARHISLIEKAVQSLEAVN
ncbi:tRNA uridine-5-carboxymethylaminomethyl(34) synthesis GTPase MnmE, partial [Streptococcus pyogenes]